MKNINELAAVYLIGQFFLGEDIWHNFKESFTKRISVQKLFALLYVAGEFLPYSFNWYLRGPYSPELTKVAYEIAENIEDDPDFFNNFELNEEFLVKIRDRKHQLESLLELPTAQKTDFTNLAKNIELVASSAYLLNLGVETDKISQDIARTKPWYKETEIKDAISKAQEWIRNPPIVN